MAAEHDADLVVRVFAAGLALTFDLASLALTTSL